MDQVWLSIFQEDFEVDLGVTSSVHRTAGELQDRELVALGPGVLAGAIDAHIRPGALLSRLVEPVTTDTEEALRRAVHEALAAIGPHASFGEDAAAVYPAADDDAKYRLWKIAARCELPEMGRHLTSALSSPPDEDTYAAALEFLAVAGAVADDVDFPAAVDGAMRRILEQPRGFRTFAGERVVALVRDYNRGALPEVVEALQQNLVEFFESYYVEENILLRAPRDDDADTALAWRLDLEMRCLLCSVAECPDDVDPVVLARFVGVNVLAMPDDLEEKMATILRGVEASQVDARVQAIADEALRIHTLDVVSRIRKTEVLKKLWLRALRRNGLRANVYSPLGSSLPRLWDTSLVSNLGGFLATAPREWWRSEIDVADTLTRWVVPLLRIDDRDLLCSAAAAARTVEAREMLSLWCDIAKDSGRHHRTGSAASK